MPHIVWLARNRWLTVAACDRWHCRIEAPGGAARLTIAPIEDCQRPHLHRSFHTVAEAQAWFESFVAAALASRLTDLRRDAAHGRR